MRKIRDFNLRLPFKETRRRARKVADLAALGLEDQRFQLLVEDVQRRLHPSVIYESFSPEAETALLAPIPGLAHTVGLATLGPEAEPLLSEARDAGPARGKVMELILRSALDRTVQFIISLLDDELEADRCELSPIHIIEDPERLDQVLKTLEGPKIGLQAEGGELCPAFSAAFCVSWIALKRGRKTAKARSGGRPKPR